MATDSLSGEPEIMASFNPVGPQMSSAASGAGGGGGNAVPNANTFVQLDQQVATSLQQYMQNVNQGFAQYANEAKQAAEDYLKVDQEGQAAISKAPLMLNSMPPTLFGQQMTTPVNLSPVIGSH